MAAYAVVQVEVTDPEVYETYKPLVPATIAKYGGEFVVRGGAIEVMEGTWPTERAVIIKFPSMADAKAWYHSDDYAGPMAIRHKSAKTNFVFVEGV